MKRAPAKPIQLTADEIQAKETAVFALVENQLEAKLPGRFYLLDVTLEKEAGYWYLRIYVEEPKLGLSINDCETISRLLDPLVDELPQLQDLPYSLEVSSPGLFRPLRKAREFEFFAGRSVRVEDRLPETKNKAKKASLPAKAKGQEGILRGYQPEESIVLISRPDSQEVIEIALDETKIVCLNPVIRIPDEGQETEAQETAEKSVEPCSV